MAKNVARSISLLQSPHNSINGSTLLVALTLTRAMPYSPEQEMLSGTNAGAPASAEQLVGDIIEPRERLEFEHLLQWLRLSFLLTPILILFAFGLPAVPYAIGIAIAIALSFTWVGLLMRYRPRLLLDIQLWLRILDCGLVYLVLVYYHGFLHDSYYDTVYLLFVVAAAATHGRRGAWTSLAWPVCPCSPVVCS